MFGKTAKKEDQKSTAPQKQGVDNDKQVAQPASTALAKLDFGALAGQKNVGMENADRDSFALPFLVILQKMSPQLDRNDPEHLPEAKEGDVLNTAVRRVFDADDDNGKGEGILVLHVAFKRSFTAWVLREKGGGYKGEFAPTDPIIMTTKPDEKKRNILPDGITQLVDTRLHAVIVLGGDRPTPALLSLTSTQIKKSKRWMTSMQEMQAKDGYPTFAHIYKLTTIPESNDQGNWYGWKIEYVGPATEQEHIDAAVQFYEALQLGQMKMEANTKAGQPDGE